MDEVLRAAIFEDRIVPSRAGWNPLRTLTIQRVIGLLEQAEYGYLADLTWLYHFVERREPTLSTLVERRTSALGACRWNIVAEEEMDGSIPGTAELVQRQILELKRVFGKIDNLQRAWRWLGRATFRGYAHLEMHTDERNECIHLEPVPQWYFGRSYPFARWQYNRDAQNTNNGTPIEEQWWVVRECEFPIDEIGALLYVGKTMSWKDWQLYVSRHGVPNIFLQVTADALASGADFADLQAVLNKYVSGGRGVLPPGVTANLFGMGGSSQNTPFPGFMEYIDKALILRGTGGKLTMLSDATGIGAGATPAHEAVFNEIAQAEASDIADILQESIGAPALNRAFPGQPHLARISITRPLSADLNFVATGLQALRNAGFKVTPEKASEMVGFEVFEAAPPAPPTPPDLSGAMGMFTALTANRKPVEDALDAADMVREAVAEDAKKALVDLLRVLAIEDEQKRSEALKLYVQKFPEMLSKANGGEAVESVFEQLLGEAFADGVEAAV